MNAQPNQESKQKIKGRGASFNPINRFDELYVEPDEEAHPDDLKSAPQTNFFKDTTKTILSYNDSPDVGFRASVNPYRGCEHGCIYCYARPTHEYFGLSSGVDFESKIFVKENAAQLLKEELKKKSWQPQTVVLSGVTDCYQPIERKLKITRSVLEVLLEFRNPAAIITKNRLVTRDIDILKKMSEYKGVCVFISLTTLDINLARQMEPRASGPFERLKAIESLSKEGIQVGVLLAPIIPALTDYEIPNLLKRAVEAGAKFGGYVIVRLPFAVKDLFIQWLIDHFPEKKEKILNRIRALRGGKLYNSDFNNRMSGTGIFAKEINSLFSLWSRRLGIDKNEPQLSIDAFVNPYQQKQFMLFE